MIAAANRCHPPFDDGGHEVLEWPGGFCDFCGFGLSGLIWSKASIANRCHPPIDDGGHEVLEWSGGFCDFCGSGLSG